LNAFIKKESLIARFAPPNIFAIMAVQGRCAKNARARAVKNMPSTKLQESRKKFVTSNRRKLAQPIHPLRRPLSEAPDKREKTKRERLMESRRPSVT
jgi:hypothetical protein